MWMKKYISADIGWASFTVQTRNCSDAALLCLKLGTTNKVILKNSMYVVTEKYFPLFMANVILIHFSVNLRLPIVLISQSSHV